MCFVLFVSSHELLLIASSFHRVDHFSVSSFLLVGLCELRNTCSMSALFSMEFFGLTHFEGHRLHLSLYQNTLPLRMVSTKLVKDLNHINGQTRCCRTKYRYDVRSRFLIFNSMSSTILPTLTT